MIAVKHYLPVFLNSVDGVTNTFPESLQGGKQGRGEKEHRKIHVLQMPREKTIKLSGKSIIQCSVGLGVGELRILKIFSHGEACTTFAWNSKGSNVERPFISASCGASSLCCQGTECFSMVVALFLLSCQEAGMCVAQQCGPQPGPGQQQPPSEEEHLFSLAWHWEGAILLFLMLTVPECFHFVFADGRCLLSSSDHQPGSGGGESISIRFIPFPEHTPASQESDNSRCCDIMANILVLEEWMCHLLNLRLEHFINHPLIVPPLDPRLSFRLYIVSLTSLIPTWALLSCLKISTIQLEVHTLTFILASFSPGSGSCYRCIFPPYAYHLWQWVDILVAPQSVTVSVFS